MFGAPGITMLGVGGSHQQLVWLAELITAAIAVPSATDPGTRQDIPSAIQKLLTTS